MINWVKKRVEERTSWDGAIIIGVVAGGMAVPFGEGVGPFYTIVPVDGMNRVLGALGNACIGEVVSIVDRPSIDFVPEGFGHFVLVDGKSGKGDLMPGCTVGIVYPVDSGGHRRHLDRNLDGGTGHAALGVGNDYGVITLIRSGGIL